MNILVSREVAGTIPNFVSYMKGKGLPRMAVENYKNGFIGFLRNYFLSANPAKSGYCYYRIPADKNVWMVSYRMYPRSQSVVITGIALRELMDGGQSQEGGGYVARLTEEDFTRMVKKALMTVITEEYSFPTNLTPGDVMIGFGKILTKIDKSGILTHAEMNELIHLGLYFNPQYSCGYFDKKKRISPHRFQQDTCSEH